jgi:hypothetical protein
MNALVDAPGIQRLGTAIPHDGVDLSDARRALHCFFESAETKRRAVQVETLSVSPDGVGDLSVEEY